MGEGVQNKTPGENWFDELRLPAFALARRRDRLLHYKAVIIRSRSRSNSIGIAAAGQAGAERGRKPEAGAGANVRARVLLTVLILKPLYTTKPLQQRMRIAARVQRYARCLQGFGNFEYVPF